MDWLIIGVVFYLILHAGGAQAASPAAPTAIPTPVSSLVPLAPVTAAGVPTGVPAAGYQALGVVTGQVSPLSETTVSEIDAEEDGLGAPAATTAMGQPILPPIPTESTAYSAASGYKGWTPALAQANVDAIGALSAKLWAQIGPATPANIATFESEIETELQSPQSENAAFSSGGSVNGLDPSLSIYSAYYSDDEFGEA